MTVHIHPKDSGPIDTADREVCNNCNRAIRVKREWVYKGDSKPSKRTKKYLNVCPYCNESTKYHLVDTLKCSNCRKVFTNMDTKKDRQNDVISCPCCDNEITDETVTVLNE